MKKRQGATGETYVYEVGADLAEEDNRVWGNITVMPLSTDHKPDDPKEAATIVAAGKTLSTPHYSTPSYGIIRPTLIATVV